MSSKENKAKRPRSDSMKWIYGLLAVCLMFLVACDNETSTNTNKSNQDEKTSETNANKKKTTEEKTTEKNSSQETETNENTNQNNNEAINNENGLSEEIPIEENVNGVKPNRNSGESEFDTETYSKARNCLLNQGDSQAECDEVENTIEFTRAWQNLSHDGYLCNDEGCQLPEENQDTNENNQQQSPNEQSNQSRDNTPSQETPSSEDDSNKQSHEDLNRQNSNNDSEQEPKQSNLQNNQQNENKAAS